MATHSVQLDVPESLFHHLKARADQRQRSVADEALEIIAATVPTSDELPREFAEPLEALEKLDDEGLWQAARSKLTLEEVDQIAELHEKRGRMELTDTEQQILRALIHRYELNMLLRGTAAGLLRKRGHDVSSLLTASAS